MTILRLFLATFYKKAGKITATITCYDENGVKTKLRGDVSQSESIQLLESLGQNITVEILGESPMTEYEKQNGYQSFFDFRILPRKRLSDDMNDAKRIKIE